MVLLALFPVASGGNGRVHARLAATHYSTAAAVTAAVATEPPSTADPSASSPHPPTKAVGYLCRDALASYMHCALNNFQ